MRSARTGAGAIWAATMMIAGTVRSLFAFLPFLVAGLLFGAARAAARSAAEALAHGPALFIVELAVAVFIELLQHPLMHRFASGLTFFVTEFSVTVLVVFFEHSLAHFAARRANSLAAIFGRLSPCRGGYHAG
jgi:hypothetical protein